MKKIFSLILALLMIVITVPLALAADYAHTVTVLFDFYAFSSNRETYTGPEFDTDGMGFTLYYNVDGVENYKAVDVYEKADWSDEKGAWYVQLTCEDLPTRIEYYSEGTQWGDEESHWVMEKVELGGVEIWSGCIEAIAKGPKSYIAELDLADGSITTKSTGTLGKWVALRTDSYSTVKPVIGYAVLEVLNAYAIGYEWTVSDSSFKNGIMIGLFDQYDGGNLDSMSVFRDNEVTVTCHCSEASEGISIERSGGSAEIIASGATNDTVWADVKCSSGFGPIFSLKIDPEAAGESWNEQILTFSIRYFDTEKNDYVEMDADGRIVLIDPDRTFTLDATDGSFSDGQTKTITKPYYDKAGTIPEPQRQGYSFNGYYLTPDDNSDDDIVPDSAKLTEDTVLAENQIWYASWSKNTYGVSYSYLDENGKRVNDEYLYKYGEEYSAPEIPSVIVYNDTRFTFIGWSPELTGTQIMSDANEFYKAQYTTETAYADYSEIDAAIAEAEQIKSDSEYSVKYTEESRSMLESALNLENLDYNMKLSQQPLVDAFAENIRAAVRALTKNKFDVLFYDDDGEVILSSCIEYGDTAYVPQCDYKIVDSKTHLKFIGWDNATDECEYVTRDMVFTAVYAEEEHSFTTYVVDENAGLGGKILVSHCDDNCGATDEISIITSCAEHTDNDNDGICDNCNTEVVSDAPDTPEVPDMPGGADTPDTPSVDDCDHLCHKDGIMGFFWKIIRFFQKLFKANPVCECGMAHY